MGQAVLRSHKVRDQQFKPDGMYGKLREDELTIPLEEQSTIDAFCEIFDLQRGGDPGLSIVVPWYNLDMTDERLIEVVVRDYFYPILFGKLQVMVETPSAKTLVEQKSLGSIVDNLETSLAVDLRSLIKLTEWAIQQSGHEMPQLMLPSVKGALKWEKDVIPDEIKASIKNTLDEGKPIGIRVPLSIRYKNTEESPQQSFFDVFIQRDDREMKYRPVFVRDDIVISDVKASSNKGIRSLVIAQDKPLATLLGDAENPAHTKWTNRENVRNKYEFVASYLNYVQTSVSNILKIVNDADEQEDPSLYMDIFSLPASSDENSISSLGENPAVGPGSRSAGPPQLSPGSPKRVMIQQISGGFAVTSLSNVTPPAYIEIHTAYDTRRGTALDKYTPLDFDLSKPPIEKHPEPTGIDIVRCAENCLVAAITGSEFRLSMQGFDPNRDLFVNVIEKEEIDGS